MIFDVGRTQVMVLDVGSGQRTRERVGDYGTAVAHSPTVSSLAVAWRLVSLVWAHALDHVAPLESSNLPSSRGSLPLVVKKLLLGWIFFVGSSGYYTNEPEGEPRDRSFSTCVSRNTAVINYAETLKVATTHTAGHGIFRLGDPIAKHPGFCCSPVKCLIISY